MKFEREKERKRGIIKWIIKEGERNLNLKEILPLPGPPAHEGKVP